MIPLFPKFKLLEWEDRTDIESLLSGLPVYSDYNFTSLWIWNVHNKMQISQLNENLIVRFSDYITGEAFLSFYGCNDAARTAEALIAYSDRKNLLPVIKLIPESVALSLPGSDLVLVEDRDAFDYLYPVAFLRTLQNQSAKYRPTTMLRSFVKLYQGYQCTSCFLNQSDKKIIRAIFEKWAHLKGKHYKSLFEYVAFERLLESDYDNVIVTVMSIGNMHVGFMINEILNSDSAICHFYKADVSYKGIYEALIWEAAQKLHDKGVQHLNFEQDLGIDSLRVAKEKYKQHTFLRKYIVQKQTFSTI